MPDSHHFALRTRNESVRLNVGGSQYGADNGGYFCKTPGAAPQVPFWRATFEPDMDLDDLDKWVWSLRWQEPDWPRGVNGAMLRPPVPVMLPDDRCILYPFCDRRPNSRNRGYCWRHYEEYLAEEWSDRIVRRRVEQGKTKRTHRAGPQLCSMKGCRRKPNRYIDYCDRCYPRVRWARQNGKPVPTRVGDGRYSTEEEKARNLRQRQIRYNEARRRRRREARERAGT